MAVWRGKREAEPVFTNQAEYVRHCLHVNIEAFRKRRLHNRSVAFGTKIAVAVIGSATTLVLGLKPYLQFSNSENWLSGAALGRVDGIPVMHF